MKRNSGRLIPLTFALGILLCTGLSAFGKDRPPIKIGFMAPYVGVLAKPGQDMDNGFRLGLEENGYQIDGRKIVMITEETEGKPELGPTKARKLIEAEKVDMIAGIVNSGVALSIRDIVTNHQIPTIITNAGAADVTGRQKSPYIFRVSFANGQQDLVGGWYAYNKLGFKRMILLATDQDAGREKAEKFKKYFVASGGQIVDELYPPISTTDFGPYLAKIAAKAKQIDGVWMFFTGSGSVRLINQYQEYGLKGTVPLFVIGDTVDETALPGMRESAVGIKNYLHYAETLNTPENQKFVRAYEAKYKMSPSQFAEQGYLGAKVILMALDAVKGDIENKAAFLTAMRKVKFSAPGGLFSFDANQNVVLPVYLREVRKINGGYANVVLGTMATNVAQDWSPAMKSNQQAKK